VSDDNTPARADVSPGDKVAGYLLEEQIGQGGMAVVYRAYDERLDRRVALKVLAPSLAADNAFRTRFIRESRAAATVEHPHIIPVYDAGDAGGCLFISMRYVQGGDVRSLLADGKAVPPARAWNIINQVASALDAAHTHNLVHRDVKPANMLIDGSIKDTGNGPNATGPVTEHIYLSDFGISKQTVASNLTNTGQFVGTLDYIAPEQIEGQGIDGRADQYSLACAAFELLCGAPPFTGPNIFALINSHLSEQPPSVTKHQPALPPSVDRVLGKAMDKAPARRYATCAQFAADLGRALGLVSGPLEADSGQPSGPPAETVAPAKPYQATELAGPAVAAAAAGAAAAGAAAAGAGAGPAAQETPGTPGMAATAGQGAVPAGGGAQEIIDQQTMTAGQSGQAMQSPPATGQQGPADQQWQAQQWQQQPPPGQQWQASPSGQPLAPGPGQPGPYGQQQYAPYQTYPQQGGPTGPTGPGWPQYQQQQPPQKRSRGPLIGAVIGVVAVVAAGAVAFAVINNKNNGPGPNQGQSSSPASPNPTTTSPSPPVATARQQAQAMSSLLTSSMQTRGLLLSNGGLVNNVGQCINIGGDVSESRQIRDQRQSEYDQAKALQTNLLTDGAALKSQLVRALHYSLSYDQYLYLWAQDQSRSGCTVGTGSQYYPPLESNSTLNNDATAAKQVFITNWNPVGNQFALPTYSPTNPPI
jgi:tRNA A-37 threonylcarbamoyl transferase component Bud32